MTKLLDEARNKLTAGGAHTLSVKEVCAALETTPEGLGSAEAAARLERFGPNALPRSKAAGPLRVFFRQFRSPLVYVLLFAVVTSLFLRDWTDAGFILLVLVVNAVIGTVQEHGAERSAEALQSLVVSTACVVRDAEEREVGGEEIVPGDVVLLEAGSKVPADMRLISSGGVEIDESLLTGESFAATKTADVVLAPETSVADRVNLAFAGTLVMRGRAFGMVVGTGLRTQLGAIARSITAAGFSKPPLLVRMERFTRRIAVAVGVAVVALGAVAVARGGSVAEVFLLAVALAVSAIPEGLPVALTVALSIGARRMGQRKVIARRLVAVEALGSCTFIASDKTGTLTMNELSVRQVALAGEGAWDVTDRGVGPEGEVVVPVEAVGSGGHAVLARLCEAAVLCNDGFLGQRDGVWVHHGDAVDVALVALAYKARVKRAVVEAASPRVQGIPFEPELRFAATLHRRGDELVAMVKGAAEQLVPMCSTMATPRGDVPIDEAVLERQSEALAASGLRVLAFAGGRLDRPSLDEAAFDHEHLRGLVFLGFVGMLDPLRPEAKASVRACQAAGIQIAMVTGDHPLTAFTIARELGLAERSEQVVTGTALRGVTAQGLDAVDALVREARVFARVEPSQKLEIVQSLIRLGHFVAATGDGANDAPALRAAHIGVAMGRRGSDVARESAELILTDDNFASIVAGVEEGRVAYANVRKVIFLLISSGAAELALFVLATAAGLPMPLLPAQLLWLNLVTNGIQDVALAFEPAEGGELRRPPRSPKEPIFNRIMIERTVVSALLMASLAFVAFRWMLGSGWDEAQARNGVLLLMVLFENIQAGNSRSETASLFSLSPLRNRLLLGGTIVAQLLHIGAMYTPGLREALGLQPVPLTQWLLTLALACGLVVTSEAHKLLLRRRSR